MDKIFYATPERWNEQYMAEIEAIWHEKPVFLRETDGVEKFSRNLCRYVAYTMSRTPKTTDEEWIVGSSHEAMLQGKLIGPNAIPMQGPAWARFAPPITKAEEIRVPPVACVFEAYGKFAYKVFRHGERDDDRKDGFASKDEAWQAVEAKYGQTEHVTTHSEYIEYRRKNLEALGTDFKAEATWWR